MTSYSWNLRWLRTILCTESRKIPVCRTMSEIDTRRSDRTKASTAAIVASVVTTCQPGCSLSTTPSLPWANLVHQMCIAGLIKHLSPYTGRISDWISFASSHFSHKKKWITARCSLRDDFNGNVTIFNVYKWRHSDVIVIKLATGTQN